MTSRRTLVIGATAVALAAFGGGTYFFTRTRPTEIVVAPRGGDTLIRPYSPVLGSADAPVTIVEFFDPACETCRAFHPVVKRILGEFPGKVRVVLRYATFHKGSDEAVRILETARLQGKFEPVLEALLNAQPIWAAHGAPQLDKAWGAAMLAGLDVARAQQERLMPHIVATLNQDAADVATIGIRGTPTFFVNGKPLQEFGVRQLLDLVQSEVNGR